MILLRQLIVSKPSGPNHFSEACQLVAKSPVEEPMGDISYATPNQSKVCST